MTTIHRAAVLLGTATLALSILAVGQADAADQLTVASSAAKPTTGVRAMSVPYADLSMDNSADIDTLVSRVRIAARKVCAPGVNDPSAAIRAARACEERAIESALAQVDDLVRERRLAAR